MRGPLPCILVTQDLGLQLHWQKALHGHATDVVGSFADLVLRARTATGMAWIDGALRGLPDWRDPRWQPVLQRPELRVVATASNPEDDAAIAALDAGCAGYCHAYAQAGILQQVAQVVATGHVWVGPTLMQRLIQGANQAAAQARTRPGDWRAMLTPRETEVADMAAQGASNQDIAARCGISERTVKAHLSAIFEKLGVVDRLQLALKVHGIT